MSTLVLSMLFLVNTATTFNDPSDSLKQHDYAYYMQKSKNQNTAAVILMVTGIVAGSVTLLVALATAVGEGLITVVTLGAAQPEHHSYTVPFLLSLAATGAGIILFSASSRNKKIARNISLDVGVGNIPQLQQQSVKNYTYPSLSLKIKL